MANLYRTGKHVHNDEMEKAVLALATTAGSYSPLFRTILERSSKLVGDTAEMARMSNLIKKTKDRFYKLMSQGKAKQAYKIWENLDTKYGKMYFEKYGKILIPPTLPEVFKREIEKETPFLEKRRRMLPGKSVKGFKYLQRATPERKGFKTIAR